MVSLVNLMFNVNMTMKKSLGMATASIPLQGMLVVTSPAPSKEGLDPLQTFGGCRAKSVAGRRQHPHF
jgi:hypothetical protein